MARRADLLHHGKTSFTYERGNRRKSASRRLRRLSGAAGRGRGQALGDRLDRGDGPITGSPAWALGPVALHGQRPFRARLCCGRSPRRNRSRSRRSPRRWDGPSRKRTVTGAAAAGGADHQEKGDGGPPEHHGHLTRARSRTGAGACHRSGLPAPRSRARPARALRLRRARPLLARQRRGSRRAASRRESVGRPRGSWPRD